eukprot:5400651-Pleurochrysis_carterae.AAC.3
MLLCSLPVRPCCSARCCFAMHHVRRQPSLATNCRLALRWLTAGWHCDSSAIYGCPIILSQPVQPAAALSRVVAASSRKASLAHWLVDRKVACALHAC